MAQKEKAAPEVQSKTAKDSMMTMPRYIPRAYDLFKVSLAIDYVFGDGEYGLSPL